MKLAVAIIHGLGSEEQFFSVELKHRIVEQYVSLNPSHSEEELIFQEIFWGDLVNESISQLNDRVNYNKDLTYPGLRRSFVDYLGVSHAYRDGLRNALYQSIHDRVRESLKKLSTTRRLEDDKTPLVVLAHSFGGVIMSDYIWDIRAQQEQGGGTVQGLSPFEQFNTFAGFVTFGNPMALFAAGNPEAFNKPIRVGGKALSEDFQKRCRWYNFYDKDDIIAYPLQGLNGPYGEAIDADIEINVGSAATSWNPACHTGYWEDEDFFKPIAAFVSELQAEMTFWDKEK